jgi:hypothetical protein
MNCMKKIFQKFICKYLKLISILFFLNSCALLQIFDEEIITEAPKQNIAFLKAEALVLNHEYEKSVPFLNSVLKKNDSNYNASLLLSVRTYDQLGQPEKAILAANELLLRTIDPVTELKTRALLLKNKAKVGNDISNSIDKKIISNIWQSTPNESLYVLESLKWSLDFSCDQFCLAEILFLKEIQIQYLYIIEKDGVSSDRAAEYLKSSYEFFESFVTKEHLDIQFRKKIALALLGSIRKLSSLQLSTLNQGSFRAAAMMESISPIQKKLESWLLQ